jgi:hypothetical protein
MCFPHAKRFTAYVHTAIRTQQIFDRVDDTLRHMWRKHHETQLKVHRMRTRRLVHRVLRHAYRPGGAMHRRLLRSWEQM